MSAANSFPSQPAINALFSMSGKTALVTGASSGIGEHTARLLASAGASVVLAARRGARVDALAGSLREEGLSAAAVTLDVTDIQAICSAFDAAERAFGTTVDTVVNNAGVLLAKRFMEHEEGDFDAVVDTNFKGAFFVAQEAAKRMEANGGGSIINIASTAALRAAGFVSAYATSKAALVHLTKVMALELASKGIRVNALCPGSIETDMQHAIDEKGFRETLIKRTPMRRFGLPEDLNGPLLLLASDAGRFMTGAVVTVDGGQTLTWM